MNNGKDKRKLSAIEYQYRVKFELEKLSTALVSHNKEFISEDLENQGKLSEIISNIKWLSIKYIDDNQLPSCILPFSSEPK